LRFYLFQSGDVWDVVVPSLPLFLLQLDGDASNGGALEPLHEMSDEPGNLILTKSCIKLSSGYFFSALKNTEI
jgi:hypothetical protein